MTHPVFTIGYEGANLLDFAATLRDHDIALVADVRAVPLSRKRGFSKNILAAALKEEGIGYRHFRDLGTPKEGREAAKKGDAATMRKIFAGQMAKDEAQRQFVELAGLAKTQSVCLLCFEAEPNECHRTIIADLLRDRYGFAITALRVNRFL